MWLYPYQVEVMGLLSWPLEDQAALGTPQFPWSLLLVWLWFLMHPSLLAFLVTVTGLEIGTERDISGMQDFLLPICESPDSNDSLQYTGFFWGGTEPFSVPPRASLQEGRPLILTPH